MDVIRARVFFLRFTQESARKIWDPSENCETTIFFVGY